MRSIGRFTSLTAALTVGALALTACGGDANGGEEASEDNPVELRFAWWGSDHRNTTTQAIIDDFEAEYPSHQHRRRMG